MSAVQSGLSASYQVYSPASRESRRLLGLALAGGACLLLAGCGSSPQDQVGGVVRAVSASRSPSKCDLYTTGFLTRASGLPPAAARQACRQAAAHVPPASVDVVRVRVRGATAQAEARLGRRRISFALVRQHRRWLVDSLGSQ
jgi:hypothetical protein